MRWRDGLSLRTSNLHRFFCIFHFWRYLSLSFAFYSIFLPLLSSCVSNVIYCFINPILIEVGNMSAQMRHLLKLLRISKIYQYRFLPFTLSFLSFFLLNSVSISAVADHTILHYYEYSCCFTRSDRILLIVDRNLWNARTIIIYIFIFSSVSVDRNENNLHSARLFIKSLLFKKSLLEFLC